MSGALSGVVALDGCCGAVAGGDGEADRASRRGQRGEDVKFRIGQADPIAQDTAVYEFSQYAMPMGLPRKRLSAVMQAERYVATVLARLSVLLGRSSGRDKVAGTVQYFAMFWGTQPFFNLTGIEAGEGAPWTLLENSMSSGRKVFRLGKWIKEYEKCRVALTAPDSYLGVLPANKLMAMGTRVLAVFMNAFSFLYYWFDNMIWAAQANLINRAPSGLVKTSFEPDLPYENYVKLQTKYQEVMKHRAKAAKRVSAWKDYKNYSSLARLLLAITHSCLQVKGLLLERERLRLRYGERIAYAQGNRSSFPESPESPPSGTSSSTAASSSSEDGDIPAFPSKTGGESQLLKRPSWERFDSLGGLYEKREVAELEQDRDERIRGVMGAVGEHKRVLVAAVCNLCILLSRLKFPMFKRLPLWVIGLLGVTSNLIGCFKNWPKFVPKPKPNKIAKRRNESFDLELKK